MYQAGVSIVIDVTHHYRINHTNNGTPVTSKGSWPAEFSRWELQHGSVNVLPAVLHLLHDPVACSLTVDAVIRLENVEVGARRVLRELAGCEVKGKNLLLKLVAQSRNLKDSKVSQDTVITHLSVFPAIPIKPSGHMAAVKVDANSSES
jgi:hypothetical protein